jgi:DNA-binding response OmpR family regulator
MNILIVEDEIIPATYLKKLLITNGYNVLGIIKSGEEAVSIAQKEEPDIILMDIMLKGSLSGAEAAHRIHFALPRALIIFLTAYSDKEMVDYAVDCEAFGYLLKPYRDDEILATLQLAKAKIHTTAAKPNTPTVSDNNTQQIELIHGYIYDRSYKRLFFQDQEVILGTKGLKLIQLLCENPHVTLDIDTLIDALWDLPKPQQTLRSLIHRVREKTTPNLITNVNKFGYKITLS